MMKRGFLWIPSNNLSLIMGVEGSEARDGVTRLLITNADNLSILGWKVNGARLRDFVVAPSEA